MREIIPLIAGLLLAGPALAAEHLAGPVPATVLRVVDGDTVEVAARVWLGQSVHTLVRLDGIDTPELHGPCAAERRLAEQARDWLRAAVDGRPVQLTDLRHDKYGGRVRAHLRTAAGGDIGAALVAAGLARPYAGGRRLPWCNAVP